MILPLRVFGSSGVRRICRGLAIGPIMAETVSRSSTISAAPPSSVSATSPLMVTKATMPCPVVGSVAPTTAASATRGWLTSACSISVVEIRWPEMFMTSSTRPSSQRSPSSSFLAPSPAKYRPGKRDQYVSW